MSCIINYGNQVFGNAVPTLAEEAIYGMTIQYMIKLDQMPDYPTIISFLDLIKEYDEITVSFEGEYREQAFKISKNKQDENSYNSYVKTLDPDEEITVLIRIIKSVSDSMLTVYNLSLFLDYFQELSINEHLINFSNLFKKCDDHLTFRLVDTNGHLITPTIALSDNDVSWNRDKQRKDMLMDCTYSSIFLQREQYALLPQDFSVENYTPELESIYTVFNKLRTVLSYIYLANTASIIENKAVLQFDAKKIGEEYLLDELENETVPKIYDWVFRDTNCVDRAGIARGIINLYCNSKEDVLGINELVFNSIKNDYGIYQTKHLESYFEMKNKISEFILDTSKQIQDLAKELTDGLKNNFIAIILFVLTALLTDSISFEEWIKPEISSRIGNVFYLIVGASVLLLIITFTISEIKWTWIERSYKDLKDNYKDILDDKDIERSFKENRYFNDAKQDYSYIKALVMMIWITLIFILFCFAVSLHNMAG